MTAEAWRARCPRDWQVPAAEIREFGARTSRYVVLIPVLNEGERIRAQIQRMRTINGVPDVVITDGGSTDGSLEPAWLAEHGVRAVLVKRGPGRVGAQLRIGFAWCLAEGYDGIVTIDGNGKDGVEAIPSFLAALDNGWDFVQGSRFAPGGRAVRTPTGRLLAIRLVHAPAVSLAARVRYHDTTNGFRAYSRRLLMDPRVQPFRDVFTGYDLLWYLAARAGRLGLRVTELPVTRSYPATGSTPTKISPLKGWAGIIRELLALLRGAYNPPGRS
jgi:dolichol-phosphate mannosyltransferase